MSPLGYFSVLSFFCISACSTGVLFVPDNGELKDARLGEDYYAKVYIKGWRVIDMSANFRVEPSNAGLYAEPCDLPASRTSEKTKPEKNYNCVEVKGIPVRTGKAMLQVSGEFFGIMSLFFGPPKGGFDHNFTINIKE